MKRRKAQLCPFIILLLFLPASGNSVLDGSEKCPVTNMRIVCDTEAGNHNPYCHQKMSKYCDPNLGINRSPMLKKCYNTLCQEKKESVCELKVLKDGDPRCGTIKPRHILPVNKSLVELRLYYHNSTWEQEAIVNLTLPDPTWKELELQYTFITTSFLDLCLNFTLLKPVNNTLMFDCRIKPKFKENFRPMKLTMQSDSGHGASYLYKIPPGIRVNPQETCPSEWQVFFYIHQDALRRHEPLPVTVQSSPYGQVEYKISLVRCQDVEDEKCSRFDELEQIVVAKNTSDDIWTVRLPVVSKAGNYTVRVQIVAEWCPKTKGCYVAVSPIFYIPATMTWLVLLMIGVFIGVFVIYVLIMIWNLRRVNREFFENLKNNKPTVLLVYHPESQAAFNFVLKLAEFLRKTCYVVPLMADDEVSVENPTNWTRTAMNEADCILFVIPKDPETPSYTPIRDQWKVAMTQCSSHEFTTRPEIAKRQAKLVHPESGDTPCEIRNICGFELSHNPAALANWLHGGSFLDQIFVWMPHIRLSLKNSLTPTWSHVRLAAQKIGSLKTNNDEPSLTLSPVVMVEMEQDVNDDGNSDDGDDSDDHNLVFDPDIPAVNDKLCEPYGESDSMENSSDEEDEIYKP